MCRVPATRRDVKRRSIPARVLLGTLAVLALCGCLCAALVFRTSPLPVVAFDTVVASEVEARIERAAVLAANGGQQTVSMSEPELNSLIHSQLNAFRSARKGNTALRDVRVHLLNDELEIQVAVSAYAGETTIDLRGRLHSEHGYLRFDPLSARVGALPIPGAVLRGAVRQAMASSENRSNMRLPGKLSDLRVEDSRVKATYN